MKKIELLAPAGNFECLIAAVQSGADAVYLSGKQFGARSFADNFDENEMEEAINYCHLRGVMVYVTVNTLVSDNETDGLCDYLKFLERIGADGIIVQDMGVLSIARQIAPRLAIHASTQMTVCNLEAVKQLEKQGVKRVVLARELSLENIKKIAESCDAEIEVFAHGALCMCYSGQCLMSSIIGGRSGNRGKCAQPCRLPYSINSDKTQRFYMSLKDLCSLEHIEELKKAGVSSLKIEGRMKGPGYVAAVTRVYRKYIDNPQKIDKKDTQLLDTIFNRGGLTDAYLTEKKGKDMFAFFKPDNPYRKGTEKLLSEILSITKTENKKLKIDGKLKIQLGKSPEFTLAFNDFSVIFKADMVVEKSSNKPLLKEDIENRMRKTGGTPFEFNKLSVELDENVFLSVGELNSIRRDALKQFEDEYLGSFKRDAEETSLKEICDENVCKERKFVCQVTDFKQFLAVKDFGYSLFFLPLNIILEKYDELLAYKEKIVIVPPAIIPQKEYKDIFLSVKKLLDDGFFGLVVNDISFYEELKGYRLFGGFRLNIYNSFSLEKHKNLGLTVAEVSPEMSYNQLKTLKKSIPVMVMAYGRLPLMVTENCVIKNNSKCPCDGVNKITDRMGMEFPVIKDGDRCRSVILNCKKTFLCFDMEKFDKCNTKYLRIYFTDEKADECIRVSQSFMENSGYRPADFTNGHFNKSIK